MTALDWLRAVRDEPTITGTRLAVLAAVGLYVNGSGFVSVNQLRQATGYSDGCVRAHVRWAIGSGWLERTRRGNRAGDGRKLANEYRLTLPSSGTATPVEKVSSGTGTPVEDRSLAASDGSLAASDGSLAARGRRPYASSPEPHPLGRAHARDNHNPDPDAARIAALVTAYQAKGHDYDVAVELAQRDPARFAQ